MTAETNLNVLLRNMAPTMAEGEYVICSVDADKYEGLAARALGTFVEAEGATVIVLREHADRLKLRYTFIARMITLQVHSSLNAVGLLAAVSAALTVHGIPTNTVSAYYHDHLFVPVDRAHAALQVLHELRKRAPESARGAAY
jgi:hypothetical protein